MLINLQNLQPIDPVTDSTGSTESREMTTHLQSEVGKCAKQIVDLTIDDPHISSPKILRQLKRGVAQLGEECHASVWRAEHAHGDMPSIRGDPLGISDAPIRSAPSPD